MAGMGRTAFGPFTLIGLTMIVLTLKAGILSVFWYGDLSGPIVVLDAASDMIFLLPFFIAALALRTAWVPGRSIRIVAIAAAVSALLSFFFAMWNAASIGLTMTRRGLHLFEGGLPTNTGHAVLAIEAALTAAAALLALRLAMEFKSSAPRAREG